MFNYIYFSEKAFLIFTSAFSLYYLNVAFKKKNSDFPFLHFMIALL